MSELGDQMLEQLRLLRQHADELRVENDRLRAALDHENVERGRAEAEVERLRVENEHRDRLIKGYRQEARKQAECRSPQITDELISKLCDAANPEKHFSPKHVMRAALEAVLPTPAEGSAILHSSESGRIFGVSIDKTGGEEHVAVTELEPEPVHARGGAVPSSSNENHPCQQNLSDTSVSYDTALRDRYRDPEGFRKGARTSKQEVLRGGKHSIRENPAQDARPVWDDGADIEAFDEAMAEEGPNVPFRITPDERDDDR